MIKLIPIVLVILGLQGCSTAGQESKSPLFGMGPSHIISSPDTLFAGGLGEWTQARDVLDLYKFNWKQLEPEKHTDQPGYTWGKLTALPFVEVMKKHNIGILSEFNQLHYAVMADDIAEEAARIVIEGHRPLTEAGGKLYGLSVDGMFRILAGGIFTGQQPGYQPLPLQEACQVLSDFIARIHAEWPDCRVAWTVNLPNWRYSRDYDYFDGSDYTTRMGGLYFMDALEAFQKTLEENGEKLGYLEVDYPFFHFKKSPSNGEKFRELQSWCQAHEVPFHLIINTPANGKPPKVFHDGVLGYLAAIDSAGIRPDALLIQSWYEEPAIYLPEYQPYTMTNTVLEAARLMNRLNRIRK